jgi:hypothetical protein
MVPVFVPRSKKAVLWASAGTATAAAAAVARKEIWADLREGLRTMDPFGSVTENDPTAAIRRTPQPRRTFPLSQTRRSATGRS